MDSKVVVNLEPREVLGKKVKQLRQVGITPVHVYGPAIPSQSLQCETRALTEAIKQAGSSPVYLAFSGGEEYPALVREIQRDVITDELLHVDFLRIVANHSGD